MRDLPQGRQGLTRQGEQGRTVFAVESGRESAGGFRRVGWPDNIKVRHGAKGGESFDRLMGRTVLTNPDRVVGENVNHGKM